MKAHGGCRRLVPSRLVGYSAAPETFKVFGLLIGARVPKDVADVAEEASEDVGAVAETREGAGEAAGQPTEVGEAAVPELDVLEIAPEILDRVEVGRVAGESLELEPGGGE